MAMAPRCCAGWIANWSARRIAGRAWSGVISARFWARPLASAVVADVAALPDADVAIVATTSVSSR